MNYEETLDYLFSRLPMFQRIGAPAFKKDLTNTIRLLKALNDPHAKFKSIHIAGTNGKGSVSSMLAAVLTAAGYKTGLYTSPHLRSFTERIRIDGEEIAEGEVVDFVARMKDSIEAINPSFFEATVAMAFDHFAQAKIDYAVVETGMGGRFDSTNVVHPEVSVITNIGLDHMQFLGQNIRDISFEKAGIIKENTPVVIGKCLDEPKEVFKLTCLERNAPLYFTEATLRCEVIHRDLRKQVFNIFQSDKLLFEELELDLPGYYQEENVLTAIETLLILVKQGATITEEHIRTGLANVRKLSGLTGRMTVLSEEPLVICDIAHNVDGIIRVLEQVRDQPYKHLHMVWGMAADKDIDKIMALLPKTAQYYFVRPDVPRGLDAYKLAEFAAHKGLKGKAFETVKLGLAAARQVAEPDDMIYVGGSTFVVAEVV